MNDIIFELDNRIVDLEKKSKDADNINIENNLNFKIEALKEFKEWLINQSETSQTIEDYFTEWDNLIKWIDKSSRRITEIDEQYNELSKTVLQEAIEKGVDFKAIYGGNTEKTRKQYVDEQLSVLLDEKKELEFLKSNDLKRIEFIKKIMDMQRSLIDAGAIL